MIALLLFVVSYVYFLQRSHAHTINCKASVTCKCTTAQIRSMHIEYWSEHMRHSVFHVD